MLVGVIGVFRSLMVQPSGHSAKILCLHLTKEGDMGRSARLFLRDALSTHTSVTEMVHLVDGNGNYDAESMEFQFFMTCKDEFLCRVFSTTILFL